MQRMNQINNKIKKKKNKKKKNKYIINIHYIYLIINNYYF